MPRMKAGQTERRRCALACESCRRRKEKCDSLRPCARCVKRDIKCIFLAATSTSSSSDQIPSRPAVLPPAHPSPTDPPPNRQLAKRWKTVHLNESADSSDAEVAIDICLNAASSNSPTTAYPNRSPQHTSPYGDSPSEAPVPRAARLLRAGRGKFIYIGDSASLSFLQGVRRIALGLVGECDLTRDRLRHSFLEQSPELSGNPDQGLGVHTDLAIVPTPAQAEMLANQYLTATTCLLDLFDTRVLFQTLQDWTTDASSKREIGLPILYLVMAIGAQVTAEHGWTEIAALYFARGRRLAFLSYTDEPSLQTVQSFILIAHYLLADTRRNAAFINLGMAVRSAYALGLHRGKALQTLFSESERSLRERIWQSLRVIDLFLSASLGRPSATSDFEKDPCIGEPLDRQKPTSDDAKFASSVLRLVSIFERILNEVYRKQGVSTELADDISRQCREWTSELPSLPVDLANRPFDTHAEMAKTLAAAYLIGAYHWSIILLTRPFLMLQVSLHHQKRSGDEDMLLNKHLGASAISTYAEASIDSAIRGLDIASNLITYSGLPKRLPFVTNSVFNSALVIGVAFFGDFDRPYPLVDGMDKAERVLAHLSVYEPQARRYSDIIGYLSAAAKEYVYQRDRKKMQNRRQTNDLFGVAGLKSIGPSGSPPEASPASTVRRDSNPAVRWDPVASGASNSPFRHTGVVGPNMIMTPPEREVSDTDVGSYHADQLPLSTSGIFINPSAAGPNMENLGSFLPVGAPLDLFDASWDTVGDDTLNFAEMIPMFSLFSEPPQSSSYNPM